MGNGVHLGDFEFRFEIGIHGIATFVIANLRIDLDGQNIDSRFGFRMNDEILGPGKGFGVFEKESNRGSFINQLGIRLLNGTDGDQAFGIANFQCASNRGFGAEGSLGNRIGVEPFFWSSGDLQADRQSRPRRTWIFLPV